MVATTQTLPQIKSLECIGHIKKHTSSHICQQLHLRCSIVVYHKLGAPRPSTRQPVFGGIQPNII